MNKKIIGEDIEKIIFSIKKSSKKLEGTTLLISGGSGFIGSYILATINLLNKKHLKKPCRVISIDNFITGKKTALNDNLNPKYFRFIEADVKKPISIDEKVDYVIHAAGIASPVYYNKYPLETIDVAINGTKNLLELSRQKKVKSFLFFFFK